VTSYPGSFNDGQSAARREVVVHLDLSGLRILDAEGREIDRWAEYRNAPVLGRIPTHHLKDMALANGMLISGIESGRDIGSLAHRMLESHWRDDSDLADRGTLAGLGREVGLDPEPLLDAALSPERRCSTSSVTSDRTLSRGRGSAQRSPGSISPGTQ